jgi:hypothetical protein
MMAEYCPVCGSIMTFTVCSNRKCPTKNAAAREWIINGVEYKFKEAVTKAEAEEAVGKMTDLVVKRKKPEIENEFIKPWTP